MPRMRSTANSVHEWSTKKDLPTPAKRTLGAMAWSHIPQMPTMKYTKPARIDCKSESVVHRPPGRDWSPSGQLRLWLHGGTQGLGRHDKQLPLLRSSSAQMGREARIQKF